MFIPLTTLGTIHKTLSLFQTQKIINFKLPLFILIKYETPFYNLTSRYHTLADLKPSLQENYKVCIGALQIDKMHGAYTLVEPISQNRVV